MDQVVTIKPDTKLVHTPYVDLSTFVNDMYAWGRYISPYEQARNHFEHEKNRLRLLGLTDTYDYQFCMMGLMFSSRFLKLYGDRYEHR